MENIIDVLNGELAGRSHKVWTEINLAALARNYKRIEKQVCAKNAGCAVIPVIKADAYGHGAAKAIETLTLCGAKLFAVSAVSEALELAKVCPEADILILGYTDARDVDLLLKYDLIQTVYSPDYARALNEACSRLGGDLRVHIKLDSGMNRLGFDTRDAEKTVSEITLVSKYEHLKCEGIFTHFACADEKESDMTSRQISLFEKVVGMLEERGVYFNIKHVCNSAGILRDDVPVYDAVRAGIILYGLTPSYDFEDPCLETVMTLKARVAHVHEVEPGESISYGAKFVADKKMKIATLPIGYADGFIRAYAAARVMIGGKSCPVVGRICMDQCMVDVSGVDVGLGDEAVIFEDSRQIEELASLADTIGYEVLCLIGKRVPRVYINK